MIRIEGIPELASRLQTARCTTVRTNVRGTSRVVVMGKVLIAVLIAVKAALQTID